LITYIHEVGVCIKKHKDEKARIEGEKADFEHAWVANPVTFDKLMAFPTHLQEVDEMAKRVSNAICTHQVGNFDMTINLDLALLFVPPSFTALRYSKMNAYRNHFRVDNDENNLLVTYDFGVASVFQQSQGSEDDVLGAIQYVGTLKEILRLDYGQVSSPIILFHCQWVKNGIVNSGNPTYKHDDVGFLLANFWQLLHELDEPFVFPSQAQQVLFWSD
ncbi:unnamed protein product, partial [Sphagnum compactum]